MENNGEHPLTLNKPQLNLWLFCQAITQIRLRGKTKWRDTFNTHFRLTTPNFVWQLPISFGNSLPTQ